MKGVDVLAVIRTAANRFQVEADRAGAHGSIYADSLYEARAAVAELIEADREHDAARQALIDLNRRVADQGWVDLEADALRTAASRFVSAQARRTDALARVTGAAA